MRRKQIVLTGRTKQYMGTKFNSPSEFVDAYTRIGAADAAQSIIEVVYDEQSEMIKKLNELNEVLGKAMNNKAFTSSEDLETLVVSANAALNRYREEYIQPIYAWAADAAKLLAKMRRAGGSF